MNNFLKKTFKILKKIKNNFKNIQTEVMIPLTLRHVKPWIQNGLNIIFGSSCWICKKCVSRDMQGLCIVCWRQIHFLKNNVCALCGNPLYDLSLINTDDFSYSSENNEKNHCNDCYINSYEFSSHRSAIVYDPGLTGILIQKFKYGGQIWLASLFARWMTSVIQKPSSQSILIPVPLHWTRLLFRRMNQSTLLAEALKKIWNIPLSHDLTRIRRTSSQGRKNLSERKKNVMGSFSLTDQGKKNIQGKTIILIDDVFTTGSTLNACSKVLLQYGAETVQAMTIAKVVQKKPSPNFF
jgi:ComF family protein